MVIETTVAFNKTGVPDAIAWKWNLDRTEFVVHVSQHVGLVKSDEASIGVLKSSFTRPQSWQNCNLYVWVMINLLGHLAKDSCCSAFKMGLSFVPIDLSWKKKKNDVKEAGKSEIWIKVKDCRQKLKCG